MQRFQYELLRPSLYSVYMRDFLDVFPREQIFVVKSEDYYQNRLTVIDKVTDFLDLGKQLSS